MRRNRLRELLRAGRPTLCMGWDVSVLFDYFKAEGGALRDVLGAG